MVSVCILFDSVSLLLTSYDPTCIVFYFKYEQNGSTPLYSAAVRGRTETVELLLDRGAYVDAKKYVRLISFYLESLRLISSYAIRIISCTM